MGRKRKKCVRWIAFMLVAGILAGLFPSQTGKAASAYIYTVMTPSGTIETNDSDEALQVAYDNHGSTININRDCIFPSGHANLILEGTTINIPSGVNVTIGRDSFAVLGGVINIYGRVDVTVYPESGFTVMDGGRINIVSGGSIKRKKINAIKVAKTEDHVLTISYGQPVPVSVLNTDCIGYKADVPGNWYYTEETKQKQWPAGLHSVPVHFVPLDIYTYEPFPVSDTMGYLRVLKAEVDLDEYVIPKKRIGEKLTDIHPVCSFKSSTTGETVAGKFSFDQDVTDRDELGIQRVPARFVPDNSNYKIEEIPAQIEVVAAKPQLNRIPAVGSALSYGQQLKQADLIGGECVNPYTGNKVNGVFSWKEPDVIPQLGQNEYTVVFTPDTEEHEKIEFTVPVRTVPKKMDSLKWPECKSIVYGQSLKDSSLSFTENEYGTFSWVDENRIPAVENEGADVRFRPNDPVSYDWTGVRGYDTDTGTIVMKLPITVRKADGKLPEIKADMIEQGQPLQQSKLHMDGMPGRIAWEEPDQKVKKAGTYIVLYTPDDTKNYDWSMFKPDVDGTIRIPVQVRVSTTGVGDENQNVQTEKPENTAPVSSVMPTGTPDGTPGTASPSETPKQTPEVSVAPTGTLNNTPGVDAPSEIPKQTPEVSVAPTGTPNNALGTAVPSQVPEQTPKATGRPSVVPGQTSSAAPAPSAMPTGTPGRTPGVSGPSDRPSDDSGDDPVIIKKISTISQIKTPGAATIGRSNAKAVSVRRIGKTVKIRVKKVKGMKYQIRYSLRKNMKKAKKKSFRKTTATIRGLKSGKKYYFQVRVWKKKKGKRVYGRWSSKKRF